MATRAEWEKRVQRWDKSGLSAAAFAARCGCGCSYTALQ